MTSKAPTWRDPLMQWMDDPPTLGEPHPGFFYPDPLGFWTEVRRWITVIVRTRAPALSATEAVAVAALVHSGEDPTRVPWIVDRCHPAVTLFLDDASRLAAGTERPDAVVAIPDPHREGTAYEGWWIAEATGHVTGKAPQHPASHNFYRLEDMDRFLRSVPTLKCDD